MKTSKLLLFILLCLLFEICQAQWGSDVRLTNNPADSWTSYNNAWCVAASGNIVHVVWQDNRDGNWEIYYKRSTDGGVNWVADTRLTNNTASSWNPSVAVSGSVVHTVWEDERDGNWEIYYKRSTDGGVNWVADTRLTNNTAESENPSVVISGSIVHVVWNDYRDGNWEIYYKRSTDGGVNWGTDIRLTNNTADSWYPSVAVSGSVIHTVWQDNRDGNWEIYYKRSTDGGVNWVADIRLTNNTANSRYSSVAVSGSVVHTVWQDDRDGNAEIYYKRSTDGGVNWVADIRLTNNTAGSFSPSVAVSGSIVHVVWHDNRDGNEEIYYKRSTDGGVTWESDIRLTNYTADSDYPSVAVSGSVVHVVWEDERDGNWEIYYKRNPTGNPVSVKQMSSNVPANYSLSQNYPNPFNSQTRIRFDLPVLSNVKLVIYNQLGQELFKLTDNEQFAPGSYEAEFDATNLSSGVYFYRLITDGFTDTRKMILVK